MLCYLPKSPFMQMVALDAGIGAVAEIAADAPDELAETLAVVRAAHDAAARIALTSPAEVLMIPENLSSEVVGPRFYERYMREYHETWCGEIAAAGKYSCIHLDGTLKGLLAPGRERRVHVHRGHDPGAGRRPRGRALGRVVRPRRRECPDGLLGRPARGLFHRPGLGRRVRAAREGGPGA